MCQNNSPAPDLTMVVNNSVRVIQRHNVVEAVSHIGIAAQRFNELESLFSSIKTLISLGKYADAKQLAEIGKQQAWDKFIYFDEQEHEYKALLQIADLDNQGVAI